MEHASRGIAKWLLGVPRHLRAPALGAAGLGSASLLQLSSTFTSGEPALSAVLASGFRYAFVGALSGIVFAAAFAVLRRRISMAGTVAGVLGGWSIVALPLGWRSITAADGVPGPVSDILLTFAVVGLMGAIVGAWYAHNKLADDPVRAV